MSDQQQGYPSQQPGFPAGAPQQDLYQAQRQDPYQQQVPPPGYAQPYPAYQLPSVQKSKLAAGLLGIFLGGLGIHRFYLGHTTIGVIQLLLTLVLGAFTFGLVGLWGFVEGIMILCGAQMFRVDAKGIPLRD
ncbi:NINE protein [Arthrobacter sp. I2-34]|uniref:NINE protein n=1 Tax=Arthrobacter hankyongi TaxID=2904801 RepID=A0ABS9L761_9MICC|nr:TM2 domain-containing protein [Arthrobacter hankyongi]MCG2622494.1 NINE protein [Arthrobacter hankyongi]